MNTKSHLNNLQDYDFELPEELIAKTPLECRHESKLLVVSKTTGELHDERFSALKNLLRAGDLLVLNDTKVFPARLYAQKDSGGKVEILAERILDGRCIKVQIKSNRTPKIDSVIQLPGGFSAKIVAREDQFFVIQLQQEVEPLEVFEQHGHVPLPPYITREDDQADTERYQTVYADKIGAVAAPTAGLHFTNELLASLQELGVQIAKITLHVGAGTFKPVQVEDITQHDMHTEYTIVSEQVCEQVKQTKAQGGRVIAVGTTCVRALESAAQHGELQAFAGDTNIFIYPGYRFKVIDSLITNFHLPRSTLIMLVSALAGHNNIMRAYQHAIDQHYRFYSYGDAMFITE
jgi:S-adenosylmethionine:tRNA ribosyltransferase-isomerase